MTNIGDFGQNRENRSTSNECRIAGTHNVFRFISFKTRKTPYRRFPMAAILSK
jgi:hypothetical protein